MNGDQTVQDWVVTIHHHGAEQQPVVVIDNFVPDAQTLIDEAAVLSFGQIGPYYPGLRAVVPAPRAAAMVAAVAEIAGDVFGAAPYSMLESVYSLVTTPPALLLPIQRLPHFDGLEAERLALLHFIAPGHPGGTSFYRHRSTGFETVTVPRAPAFTHALQADVRRHGLPPAAYIAGDTPIYERIAHYPGAYNRALLYRGHTLHCADIPDAARLTADPRTGRLTVNTFLMGTA